VKKDSMFYRFSLYGFLKNLRFFEPFMVLFFHENGLSFLQIGLLYSVRDLATNFLEIPTGVYADAFGRRKSMLMSFSAYILSFFIFYLFPNFYAYGLAMLFFASGEAFRSGTHKALILEYLNLNQMGEYKVAYYGRTRAASQLGSAVNSLIAAGLVFYTGSYRYVFIASTLPYVLDWINLATYPKELDGELAQLQRGAIWQQVRTTLKTFGALFRDAHAMRAIVNSAGFSAFFKTTKDYLQPILKAFALSLPILVALDETKRSSVAIGLVYFGIYLLNSYASRSADQVGGRFVSLARAINLTFLAGAGLLLVAGVAAWQNVAVLAILVFLGLHVLQNLRRPMNVAFISDQISHKVMASGLSVESQFTTLFMVVLSPLLGALADGLGVGAALAILGCAMLLLALLAQVKEVAETSPA
jgi:MFS family permease